KSRCNGLAIQIVREQCRRGSLRASPKWEVTILLSPAEKRRSFLGNPCESKHKLAKSKRNAADRRRSHVLLQNIAFRDPRPHTAGRPAALVYFLPEAASVAICILTILSGAVTAPLSSLAPFLILSTTSIPAITWPTTVYLLFRDGAPAKQMK